MDPLTLIFVGLAVAIYMAKKPVSTIIKTVSRAATFVQSELPNARIIQKEFGISPTITLLQAAYESNFGSSQLAAKYHNLFGLKPSTAWKAANKPMVNLPTKEAQPDGTLKTTAQYFRVYPSDLESMRDWAAFLRDLYPLSYSAARANDEDLFFSGLATGKYGAYAGPTDGSYIATYKKEALSLLASIKSVLPTGVA